MGVFDGTWWQVDLSTAGVSYTARRELQTLLAEHGATVCLRFPSAAPAACCRLLVTPDHAAAYRTYAAQDAAARPCCPPLAVRHIAAAVQRGVPVVLPAYLHDCARASRARGAVPDITTYALFPCTTTSTSTTPASAAAVPPARSPLPPPLTTSTSSIMAELLQRREKAAAARRELAARFAAERQAAAAALVHSQRVSVTISRPLAPVPEPPEEEDDEPAAAEATKTKDPFAAARAHQQRARRHEAVVVAQRAAREHARAERAAAYALDAPRRRAAAHAEHLRWHALRAERRAARRALWSAPGQPPPPRRTHARTPRAVRALQQALARSVAQRKVFVGGVSLRDIDSPEAVAADAVPAARRACVRQQRINAVAALLRTFGHVTQWRPRWDAGFVHVVYRDVAAADACLRALAPPAARAAALARMHRALCACPALHGPHEAALALPTHLYVRPARSPPNP